MHAGRGSIAIGAGPRRFERSDEQRSTGTGGATHCDGYNTSVRRWCRRPRINSDGLWFRSPQRHRRDCARQHQHGSWYWRRRAGNDNTVTGQAQLRRATVTTATGGNGAVAIGNDNDFVRAGAVSHRRLNTTYRATVQSRSVIPTTPTGDGAVAVGMDNTADGDGAVAVGNTNTAFARVPFGAASMTTPAPMLSTRTAPSDLATATR